MVRYACEVSTQNPMRSVRRSHSSRYSPTEARQRALNSAMPYASISGLPEMPSCFSTSSSTGRPWQSQPALRST